MKLRHAGIKTHSLGTDLRFYRYLGFKVRQGPRIEDDLYLKRALGRQSLHLQTVKLVDGFGSAIELITGQDAEHHIAMTSNDIRADLYAMKSAGFMPLAPDPVYSPEGVWLQFFRSPAGNLVELVQEDRLP